MCTADRGSRLVRRRGRIRGTSVSRRIRPGSPRGRSPPAPQVPAGGRRKRGCAVWVLGAGGAEGGGGDDGHGGRDDSMTTPFHLDPGAAGTTDAMWMDGYGVPVPSTKDPSSQGLVLTRNPSSSKAAISGAMLKGAGGSQLSQLSFD